LEILGSEEFWRVRGTKKERGSDSTYRDFKTNRSVLSKYSRIPPSSAGGMNGLPSPLGGEG